MKINKNVTMTDRLSGGQIEELFVNYIMIEAEVKPGWMKRWVCYSLMIT